MVRKSWTIKFRRPRYQVTTVADCYQDVLLIVRILLSTTWFVCVAGSDCLADRSVVIYVWHSSTNLTWKKAEGSIHACVLRSNLQLANKAGVTMHSCSWRRGGSGSSRNPQSRMWGLRLSPPKAISDYSISRPKPGPSLGSLSGILPGSPRPPIADARYHAYN